MPKPQSKSESLVQQGGPYVYGENEYQKNLTGDPSKPSILFKSKVCTIFYFT